MSTVSGWLLAVLCLLPLPLCAFLAIRKAKGSTFTEVRFNIQIFTRQIIYSTLQSFNLIFRNFTNPGNPWTDGDQ